MVYYCQQLNYLHISINKCITIGGPRIGKSCIFPFIIGNNIYNDCTTDFDNTPWCSVKVDQNNKHISGEWGFGWMAYGFLD